MEMRRCRLCKQEQPVSNFYLRGNGKLRHECKNCWKTQTTAWAKANVERLAIAHKMKNIQAKYGLSEERYYYLLSQQANSCAICKTEFIGTRGPTSPCVDHDHKTYQIRGLLCRHCNFAIGLANEDITILEKMIAYLFQRRQA